MNIENRVSQLEDKMNITNEVPPWIRIDAMDCSRDSVDPGTPCLAVIPGKVGKFKGTTLSRDKDEAPADFLERAERKHAEFFA
jgi:hypothetical protein